MGPYSHIVIASILEATLQPDKPCEYYWGAVAPDIRYLVRGMPRSQTHISTEKVRGYLSQYPQLKAFLQGYRVHCLSDELDLDHIIQSKFPFRLQKETLSAQHCSVILEFFNILRVKTARKSVSGGNNPVLVDMGIGDEQAVLYGHEMNGYLTSPTLASLVALYRRLGLAGDDRLEKYWSAAQRFQRNWLQKNTIMFGLQVGKVNQTLASALKSNLASI